MKETLRQIWESQGLTLAAAARKANVSDTTLSKMNRGETVSIPVQARVCNALGITLEYFHDHVEADK